jgi:putative transposase
MKRKRAYRYELKPNIQQRILLAKHAGTARYTYNWGLQQRIDLYTKEKKSTNAIEQHRLLNRLKKQELPWMYEVSKCAPQEALRDLDKAFQNFYRGMKSGQHIGFPKFKRKGGYDSFRLTGSIKIFEKSIQLPRLGILRLKEASHVEGRILSTTISRKADRWFVSITVEIETEPPSPVQGNAIGVDMGLHAFITTSEGVKESCPQPLQKALSTLQKLQRRHSRKQKGSKNRKKSAFKLAKQHLKIQNQRLDFQHKLSTELTKTKSVIVVEDLGVKEMLQKKQLSRGIADAGWGQFIHMLAYKSSWYGSRLIKGPRYYASTKTCSQCEYIEDGLTLKDREWECQRCGQKHDRDTNAAKNLLKLYTESSSGIYACGDTSDGESQKLSSHVSLKQEVMNGIFVHKL